jgi:phosphate-selective porin OprO and OprP
MKNDTFVTVTLAAVTVLMTSQAASAASVETRGGLKVTSADGRYSGQVGGRIHLDTNLPVDDDDVGGVPNDVFFRRARIALEGRADQWTYKFENDFVASDRSGFREMWIATTVVGMKLRLGQAKPYRGLEELTSSNEVTFMERPFATASGIYDGRQYQLGAFLDGQAASVGWGVATYALKSADQPATDGFGVNARLHAAPLTTENTDVHVAVSYSFENPDTANLADNARARARAAGRVTGVPRPVFGAISTGARGSRISMTGLEAAVRPGPFYLQAEYATASFSEDAAADVRVDTYYVHASYVLGGATRRYDLRKGVFKSPAATDGVTELKARFDVINNDVAGGPRLTQAIIGFNHYINTNVRAMVEYIHADLEDSQNAAGDLSMLTTRLQFAF